MHRLCLLLLTFLLPLHLFAAEPQRSDGGVPPAVAAWEVPSGVSEMPLASCVADMVADTDWQEPGSETLNGQGDLEDQTLPSALAGLRFNWHPFAHSYPRVNDGTPVFIALLRPPPVV